MSVTVESAKEVAAQLWRELGFVNRAALEVAEKRGSLECIPGIGFANFHHRRDYQTTIYEIGVNRLLQRQGWGRLLFYRVLCSAIENKCNRIVAKCPENLPSNGFYEHLGFSLLRAEQGKKRKLNVWQYSIKLPLLFYCGAGGRSEYDRRAKAEGWRLGLRSGYKNISHEHMQMVDNLYSNYDHEKHLAEVKKSKPLIATAMDILTPEQCQSDGVKHQSYGDILRQAKELAQYCGRVLLIPKYKIPLPTDFRFWLAYSVPTSHGGTTVEPEWFKSQGYLVHLLGGGPDAQRKYAESGMTVVSLDANYSMKLAQRYGKSCWQGRNSGRRMTNNTYDALQISLNRQFAFWRKTEYEQLSLL